MTVTVVALGLALPLLPAAIPHAETQTTTCRNRVFIDSVYQNGLGGNRYEYLVQVRNGAGAPVSLQLNFAGFGNTVTLFSPQLSGISLMRYSRQTIRFGNGTKGNMGNVSVVHDGPAMAGRASVAVTNCR